MNESFQKAIPLLSKIEEAGYEAYFVGGSVRDCLLHKEIADVDIATSATPEELKEIFSRTVDVGIEHGTIVVLFKGIPYEVTTFRTESEYIDFRRPTEVQFIRSLNEDLKRRDFTMNAIAMDKHGQFFDPFHGREAIKERVIKTVGNAEDRFQEDALRMMRAIRFYSQLDFKIDDTTRKAIISSSHLLEKISVERKLVEFEKLLAGKNRINALKALGETELYKYLPDMKHRVEGLREIGQYDCIQLTVDEMWALLLIKFEIEDFEAEEFLKQWKLSVKKTKKIRQLLKWLKYRVDNDWIKEYLFEAGEEYICSTERINNVLHNQSVDLNVNRLKAQYDLLPIKQRSELQVSGTDLQEWYHRTPGPWIKEKLEAAEKAVLYKQVSNRKDSIKEWLLECNLN
ncbi:CCA tRNA nucleotidyltransferase [Cytobacillus dafuensis]|uniref:CCA-adding enzyme n=1 Tax=Cytobacillus dafuensis TaxID=1742359 RepID=A0A5B8Z5P0_CYTDA|nr:CCA tRNA nucleotidyltransferase [Cytobacillus dafuensis]QED48412.1 CCA tRNA nucleotidyltransferase [Cytobacillus dafuensis]